MDTCSEAKCPSPKISEKPMLRATGLRDMGPKATKGATMIDKRVIKINLPPIFSQICTAGSISENGPMAQS